ncbi:hypothetical protein [Brevibacterium casei]|uniref:Uncharacterized protein n=1 Tax=Brevibacterium casei TaxID=33889 RepID=A0A7T9YPD0_9MICO|nr:hypothetical protein [Brevibacterium casei]MCT1551540.1 hypothetical protein [Brevibacterium casei]MCT1560983.1 hypothetical protein [Brevibacterium casei]MCT2209299.1 hypothetical protein [Brevibacterium casei]QPS33126.1 hypothetical protein I6G59_14365 [Brevibacterium casei]QQT68108.1 hypothetical protein I6I57_09950 [Brevibacterium casei]
MSTKPKRVMDVAEAANSFKALFITQYLSLFAMRHPSAPILAWYRQLSGLSEGADIPMDLRRQDDQEGLRISAMQAFERVQELPSVEVQKGLLAGPMLIGAMKIGELVERYGLNRADRPLTQFARHFRNAAAHGDKWYFKPGEPKNPAFTRDVTLDRSLAGSRATFNVVGPYEYFRFLDEITAFVGQIAFDEAIKIAHRKRDGKTVEEIHASLETELENRGVLYSHPSVQANIEHCAASIYVGDLPEMNVSPTEYPLQDPD